MTAGLRGGTGIQTSACLYIRTQCCKDARIPLAGVVLGRSCTVIGRSFQPRLAAHLPRWPKCA